MGFWGDTLGAVAETGLEFVPDGFSNVVSAAQALQHGGSAVYDAAHGDRDGAISHGVEALFSGACAIPVVGNVLEHVNQGAALAGLQARGLAAAHGLDHEQVPGGIGGLMSSTAVGITNMCFGADDTNWIADGDRPNGTLVGETEAGLDAMSLGIINNSTHGLARTLNGATDIPAPTSGAEPGAFANAGRWIHDRIGSAGGTALNGAILGAGLTPLSPTGLIAGAAAGYGIGAMDDVLDEESAEERMRNLPKHPTTVNDSVCR